MKTKKSMMLEITAKVSDEGFYRLIDGDMVIKEIGGYVPDFMPSFPDDNHYGDYIQLQIDLNTGKIINWKKPTLAQLNKFLAEKQRG